MIPKFISLDVVTLLLSKASFVVRTNGFNRDKRFGYLARQLTIF